MPRNPLPWPKKASGATLAKKLGPFASESFERGRIVLLTFKGMDSPMRLNLDTPYTGQRVRKFMEAAGVSPEQWYG